MAAAATCLRTVFRSSSFRNAAVKIAADAKASRSPFPRLSKQKPKPSRLTRSPMAMSCCVESLLPLHSANALAILNSMLAVYRRNYWLYEGQDETR
ncbi:protein NUCLEAR FUSION DEFECTIVE 6, mitochondrial-like isoform X2 [Magnolia sinica]|uniref:protein NUCLEAR FUSION DEFECTIVE 6, mitochondrial-like isoform X2 n=1 Tax=Magnolia sinica TaxID=86752 RepID=UPI00265AC7B0|nr:protein NUCLEAR FUSION DEFECTIVE 6, mitochondrial-like isoform X2 [Magnolia sinica]